MALLEMMGEEDIAEDRLEEYFADLYKVVCVSERPNCEPEKTAAVRTTYIVDWEQLVHLLEDYGGFGEDIVEVARVTESEYRLIRSAPFGGYRLAQA